MTMFIIVAVGLWYCLVSEGKRDAAQGIKSQQKKDDLLLGYLFGKHMDD